MVNRYLRSCHLSDIIFFMNQSYCIAFFQKQTPCIHILAEGVEGGELKTAERPLSMISQAARQAVDQAERRGLCYQRFQADITLAGAFMPPNESRLQCGDLVLYILPEGKRCFQECTLVINDLPCPLRDEVRFARVEHPGRLCQDDLLYQEDDKSQ